MTHPSHPAALSLALALLAAGHLLFASPSRPGEPATEWVGGLWFDGESFVARTVYTQDGEFRFEPPAEIGPRVELDGGFVVPPFGEAHTHGAAFRRAEEFLDRGIFYAKVQGVATRLGQAARPWFARRDTLDASLSMAPLSASNAHPMEMGSGQPGVAGANDLEGNWAHSIDSAQDLRSKWKRILASRPDFLKTFLLYSDEYVRRAGDPAVPVRYRGMDPRLLPEVVQRAHRAGLQVSTHVRTAADFRAAIAAGVDEIAHLPGYSIGPSIGDADSPHLLAELQDPSPFLLSDEDARRAAQSGAVVVTTVGGPIEVPASVPSALRGLFQLSIDVHRAVQTQNLELLRLHGVPIAVGWDRESGSAVDEALYLHGLGVFSNLELLRMWTETTARTIFPERRIGRLAEGFEASFLVLEANPLEEFSNVTRLRLRYKGGRPLP